jgi:RNA recognition motif-containing protein
MSSETAPVKKKKAADVDVLHCLDPGCRGMLAFEVTAEKVLNPDLHWMARQDGATRYFPCPTCHGRNVVEVKIVMDRETGRPRGFAFVEMSEPSAATDAIRALDGTQLGGRALKVNEAQDKQRSGGGGGGGGGGFRRNDRY